MTISKGAPMHEWVSSFYEAHLSLLALDHTDVVRTTRAGHLV